MKEIEFTEEEREALHYERYHHPHPHVQRKMEALWLKSLGYPPEEIMKIVKVSKTTLYSYLKEYREGGVEKLKELNFRRPESELSQYTKTLEEYFKGHPPANVKEAMLKIDELTGIKRGETQTRKFLKKLGIR